LGGFVAGVLIALMVRALTKTPASYPTSATPDPA
jgi:hypothetical protein